MAIRDWFSKGKQHEGESEYNSRFNRFLSGFWRIVGLPHYKTIIGSSFAWCGLFVAYSLYTTGHPIAKGAAGARNWMSYGKEIEWRKNGIPRGAIVQINHNLKCGSGSGNHVGFANGDCTIQDLLKDKATIDIYGGNQQNRAKVSTYSVKEICAVRWPPDVELPSKVLVSDKCTSGSRGNESTR